VKILAVSPIPEYATRDVWRGQCAGFEQLGCEVTRMEYGKVWQAFADFSEMMVCTGRSRFGSVDVNLMAGDRIVMAALVLEVDLVWLVAPMHVSPTTLKVLQSLRKLGIKTAIYFTECPYDDDSWQLKFAELCDYAFICDNISLPAFLEKNSHSFYVGHAYDPALHYPPANGMKPDIDVSLVMTLFPSRVKFLEQVNWDGIDMHLYGITPLGNMSPLRKFVRGGVLLNDATTRLYHRSRIGVQFHRNDSITGERLMRAIQRGERGILGAVPNENLEAYSIAPRCYELAACGTFQVCDEGRAELREVFGDSVPTYRTPDELGLLLRRHLDDPVRREELAQAQHEAVKPYTFEARMRQALEAL